MLRRRRLLCLALILGGCPEPSDASPATAEITVTDLGPVFDAGRPPRGVLWYVYLAASDAVDLPLWARVWVCGWDDGPDGEQAVLSVDSAAYERLVATGLPFAAVREEVPWKVFHAEFRARVGRAPEARGRGFVLDDSYKDPEIVADILFAYHTRYPELTALVQIGQSHQGRPIWALKVSDRPGLHEDEPPILFDAAHHASELITIEYVLDIVDTLLLGHGEDARITKWVEENDRSARQGRNRATHERPERSPRAAGACGDSRRKPAPASCVWPRWSAKTQRAPTSPRVIPALAPQVRSSPVRPSRRSSCHRTRSPRAGT